MDSKQRCLEKLGCGPAHYDTQNLLTLWIPIKIKIPTSHMALKQQHKQ